MKEWLTARELAEEALPDLPTTESGALRFAVRNGWDATALARPRPGQEDTVEYHLALWPSLAQVTYSHRHLVIEGPAPVQSDVEAGAVLSARAGQERDARLAIVTAFKQFSNGSRLGYASRVQVFTDRYNAAAIEVAPFVRETVPVVSKRSLARWQSLYREGKTNDLAFDPASARKGTGVLDSANDGQVLTFILGLIAHQPHLSGEHVQTLCRDEFGDTVKVVSKGVEQIVTMPPVRTFQHVLKRLKVENKVALTKITNPDLYRSTLAPAGVGMLRHVREPNQLWQIDASPVDALCIDGRHSVYACIDIATRRMIFLISRTPRASAVALLIRKAIMAWGVPERIKTDNGSDFKARDTQRLLASLGIEMEFSTAYQPQEKGHIERGIGTFQRLVGPLLPGFIGHDTKDRKAIEARKAFAERMGETDAEIFGVSLNGVELQAWIDKWAHEAYQHHEHAGLGGNTPFKAALASQVPVRRVDERALDLLLMPVAGSDGMRKVTKFGIRIDHHYYMMRNVLPGTTVFVRQNPNDLGLAYVFEEDGGRFLGDAVCPELSGLDPRAVASERKAMMRELIEEGTKPIREAARRISKGPALIERYLSVKSADAPNVIELPKRSQEHSTAQISAAIEAMGERLNPSRQLTPAEEAERQRMLDEMRREEAAQLEADTEEIVRRRVDEIEAARTAHLPTDQNVVALPESPKQRYMRALKFQELARSGELDAAAAVWLGGYLSSGEFRAQRGMHDDFGEAYLSE